jgi:predicted branched-subunit amino acid permease
MSKPNDRNTFKEGVVAMLPIIPGVIPFGLIMGSVSANTGLSYLQTISLNIFVFAGASQLTTIDLFLKDTSSILIVITGLIINMRFLLYSASSSSVLKGESFLTKFVNGYLLTDQSYAVTETYKDTLNTKSEKIRFMFGTALTMALSWHIFVSLGYFIGNVVPKSLSLDFAVPLSFLALTIPGLKTKGQKIIALLSSLLSILFYSVPFNLGLLITVAICLSAAYFFYIKSPSKGASNE